MGLLDRLLGRRDDRERAGWSSGQGGRRDSRYDEPRYDEPRYDEPRYGAPTGRRGRPTTDEAAIERYRYLLRTAPPERIEQAHAEAFARLTPEQRRQVLEELSAAVPPGERARSDDPASLARMATRAEMREPGTMERVLGRRGGIGGMGGGMGMGGLLAGSLLASVAGAFVGTAIADAMFDLNDSGEGAADAGDTQAAADTGHEDAGGGYEDAGGDWGGGDFGGGDF